jgi:hypothetical protein
LSEGMAKLLDLTIKLYKNIIAIVILRQKLDKRTEEKAEKKYEIKAANVRRGEEE